MQPHSDYSCQLHIYATYTIITNNTGKIPS